MDVTEIMSKVAPIAIAVGFICEVIKRVFLMLVPAAKDSHVFSAVMTVLPLLLGVAAALLYGMDWVSGVIAGSFASQAYDLVSPALKAYAERKLPAS